MKFSAVPADGSRFAAAWSDLAGVGRDRIRGGYSRHGFDDADLELRTWFTEQAERRGLEVENDRNGNVWAWWGAAGTDAVVTGSHLDSVPGGGAFDGPLGVVSALLAVDELRLRGVTPARPLAVACFVEEEGGRFGLPCMGSRLMTGAVDPDTVRRLHDPGRRLGRRRGPPGRGWTRPPWARTRPGWHRSEPSSNCTSSRADYCRPPTPPR